MSDERKYYDLEGHEVTLDSLCRKEPEWAANRLRTLERERDEAIARADAIARVEKAEKERDEARAEVERWKQAVRGIATKLQYPMTVSLSVPESLQKILLAMRNSDLDALEAAMRK